MEKEFIFMKMEKLNIMALGVIVKKRDMGNYTEEMAILFIKGIFIKENMMETESYIIILQIILLKVFIIMGHGLKVKKMEKENFIIKME